MFFKLFSNLSASSSEKYCQLNYQAKLDILNLIESEG